jgi:hypothetical protein
MKFRFVNSPFFGAELNTTGKPAKTDKGALLNSIRKWKFVAEWVEEHKVVPNSLDGRNTCNLCLLHLDNGCQGCPINKEGNHYECKGTPNDLFEELTDEEEPSWKKGVQFAKQEIKFLEKLYKKEYGDEPQA